MRKFILGLGMAMVLFHGTALAADPATDSKIATEVAENTIDLDDRFIAIVTPTSKEVGEVILVNRFTKEVYKVQLTKISEGDE